MGIDYGARMSTDPMDWRLPDLPIETRPSTFREKAVHDAVQEFVRDVERHRERLLAIVLGGKTLWRQRAQAIWRGLRVGEDHQLLDAIFAYFELQSVPPRVQRQLLDAQHNPAVWRDIMTDAMPDLELEREHLKLVQKWSPYGR